jgi:uncharacterized protein involved in propanediol utilization
VNVRHQSNSSDITTTNVGFGQCFGTFGELLQGVLPDDRNFLVTLPITQYATARFVPEAEPGIRVLPPHKLKSRRLAEELSRTYAGHQGGSLILDSELPEGKGLASSSADMVATALAIQDALGFSISADDLASLMASIEPTDGVMFPGIVSFHHREGVRRQSLGHLPSMTIVALDEGGCVDTVSFNRRPQLFSHTEKLEYAHLLETMEAAVMNQDLVTIGQCATHSAEMNQKVLRKRHLDLFLDLCRSHSALGVVVAHSGTCIGLLLDRSSANYPAQLAAVRGALSGCAFPVYVFQTNDFSEGGRPDAL